VALDGARRRPTAQQTFNDSASTAADQPIWTVAPGDPGTPELFGDAVYKPRRDDGTSTGFFRTWLYTPSKPAGLV
jgi:hypothetical protein